MPSTPSAAEANAPSSRAKVDSAVAIQIKPEAPGDLRYKDRRLIVLYFDMEQYGVASAAAAAAYCSPRPAACGTKPSRERIK